MIFQKIQLILFLMFVSFNSFSEIVNKDFYAFCGLIQAAMAITDAGPQERLAYVNKYFESTVGSKEVRETFDLVFQVESKKRYLVFNQAVENNSGQSWGCPALNEFFK